MNTDNNQKNKEIEAAIEILQSENKKVNVNRVRELTGLSPGLIAKHPKMQAFLNPHFKLDLKAAAKFFDAAAPNLKEEIEQTCAGYIKQVKDTAFDKPQTLDEVQKELQEYINSFNIDLYRQAVTVLIQQEVLIKQSHSERYLKVIAPSTSYVIEIPEPEACGNKFLKVSEDALDFEVKKLLHSFPKINLNIYRLNEIATSEIKVVRTKAP